MLSALQSTSRQIDSPFRNNLMSHAKLYNKTLFSYLVDFRNNLVVILKELEILERDINIRVPTKLSVLLLRIPPTAKSMFIDLVLDLIRSIRHVDGGVRIGCGHLGLRTLERGDEFGVEEAGFGVF